MGEILLKALRERERRGEAIGAKAVLDRAEEQLNGEISTRLFRPDSPSGGLDRVPSPIVALSAAAIVLLVALATASLLRFGFTSAEAPSTEPVQQVSTTQPTEQVSTTQPVAIVAPPPETMWERIVDEAFSPGAIWAVASTDDVIVAVGEVPDPDDYSISLDYEYPDGVVWVSTDGYSWERIDDEAVFAGDGSQLLDDVAVGPLGFVASGFEWPDAALWFSPDGYEWHKVLVDDLGTPNVAIGFVVVAGGPGWVAANLDWGRIDNVALMDDPDNFGVIDDPSNLVFVSEDGLEWRKVEDVAAIDEFVAFVESAERSAGNSTSWIIR
ncbi:MAG: hypothetical protein ACC654_09190, partial [Acidimicrobiia bacterium]